MSVIHFKIDIYILFFFGTVQQHDLAISFSPRLHFTDLSSALPFLMGVSQLAIDNS
jgi:hypothetical protein